MPFDEVASRQELSALQQQLLTLSKRTRDIVILRRVDGFTTLRTAKQMGVSRRTVEKELAFAMVSLRTVIERKCS